MGKTIKKITKFPLVFLDELSYFVPSVFLILGMLSIFLGEFNLIVTLLLFITYLATSYGENLYAKKRYLEKNVNKVIRENSKIMISYMEKEFVSLDVILAYSDFFEEVIAEEIQMLRDEINGGIQGEVGTEEAITKVQENRLTSQ